MAEIQNPFDLPAKVESAQERFRQMNELHKGKPGAVQYYLRVVGGEVGEPTNAGNVMQMGHYCNPDLAVHSQYFGALDKMMSCVQRNVSVTDPAQQEKVCAAEFKNLRIAGMSRKLEYSEVNRRHFIRELEFTKKNFAGF